MPDHRHPPDDVGPTGAGAGAPEPGCADALKELYTFLDGELTQQRRVDIGSHLDHCNECLEAFDFEAELRIVIASRCREHVPEGLKDRIARALSEVDAEG